MSKHSSKSKHGSNQKSSTSRNLSGNTSTASATVSANPSERATQSSTTKPRDLDRCRAQAAWENIQEIATTDKEYGSLAREMPTLIQVNGLAQTLAFLKAKDKPHHQKMFQHLSDWVCQQLKLEQDHLLENILRMNSQVYRRATAESLAFLQWLKRFAESKIEKSEEKAK